MTSLSDRFGDVSVAIMPFRPRRFSTNQVALGFINAMKIEAIKDCDERMTSYTFTDTEYEESDVRIRVTAADRAPQQQLVRCNVMYAIKTLAIAQLEHAQLYGARFVESYRGQLLYGGTFDNKNDDPSLEQIGNSSADLSGTVSQEKRAPSTQMLDSTNSTTTLLTIAGSNDVEYHIDFFFTGNIIPKLNIFSAILEFMMTIAQRDGDARIENISQATSTDAYWIFVEHIPASRSSLQVFEVAAILESIARYSVSRGHYGELSFHLLVDRELAARGCVTQPVPSREWCRNMR